MLGLALHTTSPQLGLMLQSIDGAANEVKRHQIWNLGRDVSSHLHIKLTEFISPYTWQDLSYVAVAKGPGGFTGTRVGVVAARTLAQQLEIPLFGVSTLAALAVANQKSDSLSEDIAVMMPAKREQVFGALYRTDGNKLVPILEEQVLTKVEWMQQLEDWERPLVRLQTTMGEGIADSVVGVSVIALAQYQKGFRPDWHNVVPFYGQHPVVNR